MIYRLTYCNKDGVEARVDIQKGLATPIIEVEGTERPFILSYNNDKGDKSGMFLSSSADIEIYETPDFNIDNLKTSNETELSVTHYINNVVSWQGFIIPDFFSIEVKNNPVISMTASDRLGTLKNVTLSDLPSMISLRELAVLCLNKTGLELPLKTMADFNSGTGTNDFFNSKILTQRLTDTKGRSISCYDILSSILTASNSKLLQRGGEWIIINKVQHEAGSGKLFSSATSFINWSDVIFNFSDISIGGRRTIIPVASSVGVYHEHGGGRFHPENFDFSKGTQGWIGENGFTVDISENEIKSYTKENNVWNVDYGDNDKNRLKITNISAGNFINLDLVPYAQNTFPIITTNKNSVGIDIDLSVLGMPFQEAGFVVLAYKDNDKFAFNPTSGAFEAYDPQAYGAMGVSKYLIRLEIPVADYSQDKTTYEASTKSVLYNSTLEADDLTGYNVSIRVYGTGSYNGSVIPMFVNFASARFKNTQELPKGNIYKTEKVDNFTKAHDIDTSLFADYLTTGLNGYFYDYSIDDTSSLYNASSELTSKWTAYNDTDELPLLQHVTRQKSRLFSVAHDLLSAEIEASNFDPLAIFVACGVRHTVVSAQFDFFKSNLSVELEEVAFPESSIIRDFIYSYFGDGETGVKSIGGISGGSGGGGGTGGGLTPGQIEILSFWKKDPDNENTIFTEMNAYSKLELSAYGLGSGGGGGGEGSLVTWGTELNGGVGLTVDGITKTLALKSGLDLKQDKLTAGTGITIIGNTISLAGGGGGGDSAVEWGTLTNGYRQLTVEGVTYALAQNTHKHLWADITDKPSTFAPSAHTHSWAYITDKPSTFAPSAHTHAWGDITSKPSTFAPSAHTHLASDITSGTFAIARIPTGTTSSTVALGNHTHAWTDITDKPSTFAPSAHTHLWADITDKPSTFAPSAHTHSAGDITSGTFAIARIPTGSTASTVALGNHLHTGVYEPVFSKNTAFNKNFGTDSGTVAQGNDSRITNGQTAYGWGNHASAGYALNSSLSNYVPTSRTITAGNGLTGGGTLAADRTITLGTPSTLTATSTNAVTATSHTHAITTTSVGAANTIVQTDATGGTKLNNLKVGGDWKLEQIGTELLLKYNNLIAARFLSDGSIVGLGEITAYGASTGGEGVALLRTGGTMTGDLVLDANLGIANKALTLLGNSFKYNGSIVLTEANTSNKITMGNGWTIEQTSASLTIRKNGVIKGTFNA